MKTSLKTTTIKCEEQQNYSSLYFPVLALHQQLRSGVRKLNQMIYACRAVNVGRNVKQCLQYLVIHRRITCGVVIILTAPLSLLAYTFFDPTVDDRTWYFTSMYWYAWTIGPYACFGLWSIGAFLLFPTKSAFRYIAILPVISFCTTAIIHFTFFVRDYESFHSHSFGEVSFGISTGVAILLCTDYLLYRKYHLNDGNLARINGIIKTPGIPAEQKVQILETLIEERQNFYARV